MTLYINTSEVVHVVVDQTKVQIEMIIFNEVWLSISIIFLRAPHYHHHREQFCDSQGLG